ncbi:hypothetical protein [Amycolatopsis sp. cg13]|uniref:hypothetical protein n=1 Tax=Amycolatopsis sp. cg13 TaxID=3238807 RepID=UPI003525D56D
MTETEPWAAVRETHSGAVFFAGDRAWKLKKPVDLGFLDFTDPGVRERVCRREVELNRRLAPDVYLGVAAVTGPDGAVCDHLVAMRRMPDDRRMSGLVRRSGCASRRQPSGPALAPSRDGGAKRRKGPASVLRAEAVVHEHRPRGMVPGERDAGHLAAPAGFGIEAASRQVASRLSASVTVTRCASPAGTVTGSPGSGGTSTTGTSARSAHTIPNSRVVISSPAPRTSTASTGGSARSSSGHVVPGPRARQNPSRVWHRLTRHPLSRNGW